MATTSQAAINLHKNQKFDFSNVADLASFWDGSKNAGGAGGGTFNNYDNNNLNISSNIDNLFQSLVGRNADPKGKDYWHDKISSGANTYQTLIDSLKASKEYTGQQDWLTNNPDATSQDLKSLGSAYVSPFNPFSGSAVADWKPGDKLTSSIANAVTTDPNVKGSNYSDQKYHNINDIISNLGGGVGGLNSGSYTPYDDSGLRSMITGLRDAFDAYKKQSASDMQNMWNNANWGWGQTVGGVRTQNELPGWTPKRGGTSGFFGRGGRSGQGLTTSSLNI